MISSRAVFETPDGMAIGPHSFTTAVSTFRCPSSAAECCSTDTDLFPRSSHSQRHPRWLRRENGRKLRPRDETPGPRCRKMPDLVLRRASEANALDAPDGLQTKTGKYCRRICCAQRRTPEAIRGRRPICNNDLRRNADRLPRLPPLMASRVIAGYHHNSRKHIFDHLKQRFTSERFHNDAIRVLFTGDF